MRDGHIRVLPLNVANKIAAGEVVERPASVVKELVENSIDAGAKSIKISTVQGGRKLVAVQDDGCGMTRDDATLSLERQATSKILDVDDIERIDTLGFRGEAIPSIASVSRFTLTTRRHDDDEGTLIQVNAGLLAEIRAAGCPAGTLVEVRDLFCNVPARRKFLRAYATEENHVKQIFTVHALAHPAIAFSLTIDGREIFKLPAANSLIDRVRELFGAEFLENLIGVGEGVGEGEGVGVPSPSAGEVTCRGYIERPNLSNPSRREQYIFVNGRPATSPSIAYALKEAYPRHPGDVKPAAILFIELPPGGVDVNVHPTKREVRFRDNPAVKAAIMRAIDGALTVRTPTTAPAVPPPSAPTDRDAVPPPSVPAVPPLPPIGQSSIGQSVNRSIGQSLIAQYTPPPPPPPTPAPIEIDLPIAADENRSKPWKYFKYLAQSESGYLLIETDAGIVTINPIAARERIAYEKLLYGTRDSITSQPLLIPETVQLTPVEFSRIRQSLNVISDMGFQLEEFGVNTFKVDATPQLLGSLSTASVLSTIANDLGEDRSRRAGERWLEEKIAKSIARSFAGAPMKLNEQGAIKLVEELCQTKMPYICPRGRPVMIFTSTRELNRKFSRE